MDYKTAKNQLLKNCLKNIQWLKENGYILEYSYALILNNQTQKALQIIKKISANDIRANWCEKIIPILDGSIPNDYPSYLQVRNFLEVDLTIFLENKKNKYAENIINQAEYFFEISRESYKYIGRALYYNNKTDLAEKILQKAKDEFYKDAETHYILSKIYYQKGQIEKSEQAIKKCIKIIPDYIPAQKLLQEIKIDLTKKNVLAKVDM